MPGTRDVTATRDLIMTAAERLFATRGVAAVSARQISEAAGQGNTAAVGYHFGTKNGLIKAIIERHSGEIERIRARMASAADGSGELRDWIACLVRPSTEHLATLGPPSYFARFAVQVLADPRLRHLLLEATFATPAIGTVLAAVDGCLSGLPDAVRTARDDMANSLILHVVARHERGLADDTTATSWPDTATMLIDALVGLFTAPVTS
ncbi:MAG: TetR/AcrR family transcriptional regulator [Streptosporangiales bacterium]|nr:TetR/AcrR family transcriptional regulator [Streptosporangiales bacterium]